MLRSAQSELEASGGFNWAAILQVRAVIHEVLGVVEEAGFGWLCLRMGSTELVEGFLCSIETGGKHTVSAYISYRGVVKLCICASSNSKP